MDDLYSRQQALNTRIFEKALEDPQFRDRLLADAEAALAEAGLTAEIEALDKEVEELAEVGANCGTRFQACQYWSSRYYCPGYGAKFGPWISTK